MLSNNLKKYIRSLHQRKYRQKYNKLIVEGSKSAIEVLDNLNRSVNTVVCTDNWWADNGFNNPDFELIIAPSSEINTLSHSSSNKDVIVLIDADFEVKNSYSSRWTIYLDAVQDPGNVGTIIRIADWYGIPKIYVSPDSAQIDNPKVLQSTMGSFTRVQVEQLTLENLVKSDWGKQLVVADLEGEPLTQMAKLQGGCLVIGNEGKGPSDTMLKMAHIKVTIPGFGVAESLNASVSCGICCSWLIGR